MMSELRALIAEAALVSVDTYTVLMCSRLIAQLLVNVYT
jgi:hypothetical protein